MIVALVEGSIVTITITGAEIDAARGVRVVCVEGQRRPIEIPLDVAPRNSLLSNKHVDFIVAEIERRKREALFQPKRHDEYKGFRL